MSHGLRISPRLLLFVDATAVRGRKRGASLHSSGTGVGGQALGKVGVDEVAWPQTWVAVEGGRHWPWTRPVVVVGGRASKVAGLVD